MVAESSVAFSVARRPECLTVPVSFQTPATALGGHIEDAWQRVRGKHLNDGRTPDVIAQYELFDAECHTTVCAAMKLVG
jgi:hypothetical protein